MNIEIRKIEPTDVAALAAIAKETFYSTFKNTCTAEDMQHFLDTNYTEEVLLNEINNSNYKYFFAEIDNKPIGYILFAEGKGSFIELENEKPLELKRIYVVESFQGKGVAQKIMDFYLDYAKTNNYTTLFLGVWEHNEKAKAFYAKYGFENSGYTHDFPIGNTPQTDIWLWKFL
jgi:GNAT superfamily N-acetyltransferase